jgi:hypothetical protein
VDQLAIVAHAQTMTAAPWEIHPHMTTEQAPHRRPATGPSGPVRWPYRNGQPARDALIVLALAGYAWAASAAAPFTGQALAGVLIPGAALGLIAYGRPPERIPAPDRVDVTGFSYWAVCIAATLEWEASAFRSGSHPGHPSLTELIDPLIQPHPVRGGAFLVWLLAGWALVRR